MLKMWLCLLLLAGVLLVDALAIECVPRRNCPSITGSEYAHSAWFPPPINKGENFQAWQVYNTTGHAQDLHVHWDRTPYPLGCSTVNISTIVIDNYINATITVYNATVQTDGSCSDEGEYQLVVSNNCTCNDTIVFHLSFISPCNPLSPPSPAGHRTVVVPEPRPGDPTTFCLNMSYVGKEEYYDTRWQRGDEGDCGEKPLCADDDYIKGHQYKCSSKSFGKCTFLSKLCMPNYTKSLSGNYTTLACPASGNNSTYHLSNATTLDLRILGWPRLIQWPGDTVSIVEGTATLIYQLSNFSQEFIDLKFYNGSELMSSKQVEIVCENTNCEMATIRLTVPAEGEYKMCYNFSSEVNWTLKDDSPPEYKVPNCTQITHVVTAKTGTLKIVGITAGAAITVILLLICGIFIFKVSRKPPPTDKPNEETGRLLPRNCTPPQYGSSDESTSGELATVTSEQVSTQEIPTDNDPASTAHGPVLAQDYPVAVGRQSGGDEAGSSTEVSTCTGEATTAAVLAPAPSAGVQYSDDVEEDTPYSTSGVQYSDDVEEDSDDVVEEDAAYPDTRKKPIQGLPNPQRCEHFIFGLLKKVFILFPHNPNEYTQSGLPTQQPMSSAVTHGFGKEVEQKEHQEITRHQDEVYRFACFLQRNYIAVGYDLMLKDTPASDVLKWVEDQINGSDYVILIITPSFSTFLADPPPHEKECIFGTGYVSRLVNYPTKTKFLVVFLNREKDEQLLPTALRGHTLYEICEPFVIGETRHDDLEDLYAVLTNQKRYTPSEPLRVIPLTKHALTEEQQRLYEDLSRLDTQVTRELITRLAQKQCVCQHYKRLAITLVIPAFERKIEETSEEGDEEICYQLLLAWKGQPNTDTTIKTLAKALVEIDPSLLVELHRAVFL